MASALALLVACAGVGQPAQVVVVKGTYAAKVRSSEGRSAGQFYSSVADALRLAGVEFGTVTDEDVASGKLAGAKVAIFAYTPVWAPGEVEAAVEFIDKGGKVVVFYVIPSQLSAALGIAPGKYTPAPERGYFHECRLAAGAPEIQGLPPSFIQDSWNIDATRPVGNNAKVLYEWYAPDGKPTGHAALIISDTGAYMSHVLTRNDLTTKGRLLLALLGHWIPDLWPAAAARALKSAWQFDAFSSLEELRAIVERAEKRGIANEARPVFERAAEIWQRMNQAVEEKRYADAIDLLDEHRAAVIETYARCQPTRPAEMRATWIHTAFGVADWGWEKSIRHLKEMGFNAILPNMLWGGVAYYDSAVLPVHESVRERGDQVAECAKWCRKYGVELHVWKVNWNLGRRHIPDWFREQLRKEGRLQQSPDGKEVGWLCPTDERNFRLERDSMLELVRNYDIAGIHFDYIRYPGMQGCYCPRCRRKFEERIGKKVENWPEDVLRGPYAQEWLQFRRDNITRLVRAVSTEAHRIRPDIKVSAAVFGYWESSRDSVGQDWVQWIDEGLLDFVCPMDYIPNNEALRALVAKQVRWVGGRIPLYIGLGEWRLRDAAHLAYQIEMVRELGADGYVLFHYNHSELTDRRMPALRLGITRSDAIPLHVGPPVQWSMPEGLADMPPRTYLAGSEVSVAAKAQGVPGGSRIELRALDGRRLRVLGDVQPGQPIQVTIKLRHEPCRIAVAAYKQPGEPSFVRLSPILWPISPEEYEEQQARLAPPKFEGEGLRVGVYAGGYGSSSILAALEKVGDVQAKPVYSLRPEMMQPCQVLIVPQPKNPSVMTPEVSQALRGYAMRGGFVLLTHDAVGFRRFPVIFPEVCAGGTERVEDAKWRLVADVPGDVGLERDREYTHTFYDHILVSPGPNGRVLATDASGRALVVEGWFGKGRVCASGIALGVGPGDSDVELSEAEMRLLRAILAIFSP